MLPRSWFDVSHSLNIPVGRTIFNLGESRVGCGILLISVRMRAPSAPHMSSGSRANQAKPEALSSCSEQYPKTAILRETAGLRPHKRGDLRCKSFFERMGRTPHWCASQC
jgi:hypothetical protein